RRSDEGFATRTQHDITGDILEQESLQIFETGEERGADETGRGTDQRGVKQGASQNAKVERRFVGPEQPENSPFPTTASFDAIRNHHPFRRTFVAINSATRIPIRDSPAITPAAREGTCRSANSGLRRLRIKARVAPAAVVTAKFAGMMNATPMATADG